MANRFLNNIRINDEYTLPAQDGTADQIIATDGAGNLSFVDAAVTSADSNLVYYDVKNSSGATINKGKAVRAVGTDGNSGHILIDEMVADGSVESKYFIGVLETALDNGDIGRVIHFGELDQFNTLGQNGETWNDGDILWLDPSNNGDYTITEPNGPNLKVAAAIVKNAATNGKIHVRVQANEGVHDLHDVNLGALGEGDLLTYDSSLQVWKDSGQSTTAAQMPSGTTAERPTGVNGMLRYNTDDSQFEGYANNTWGAIAGSGGGGGTELSIERNVFTATANQTAFTISSAITASSNTQVYIDGVYQAKSNYTTSGSTITFSTGVPAGSEVEVIHFISVLSKVYTDTFTGNGTTVNFTASKDVTDEKVTQVYIDGVYQSKDNYTTSGTTITFSTAPPSGSAIEVVHFTPAVYSTLNSNQFTGTGSQTDFTLTQAVEEDKSFVFIQGIYQEKSTYSISGTTLTFTTAPQSGYTVEVITVGAVSIFNDTLYVNNFNGTGSQVDYTLSTSPASENAIDVYINGLYQQKDTFSLSGSTLTFSTAPPNGSTIEVKSTGGLNNVLGNVTLTAGTGISIVENSNNNFTISNTLIDTTVSYNTPTGQSLTYTTPSTSTGQAGSVYGPQTFTITGGNTDILSGTASISGLPNGLTVDSQSYNNSGAGNILTITLGGVFPSSNSLNTNLTISGLTISTALLVDYLVVAGGGSGGAQNAGGGGAGGLRTSYGSTSGGGASAESRLQLDQSTNYTVTVGAGGASPTGDDRGLNGSNSVFSTITSTGGGGGGGQDGAQGYLGQNGGSGGGGNGGAQSNGGNGTANQGYDGGDSSVTNTAAGGGGAGAAGSNPSNGQGGNGGVGVQVNIDGNNYYWAGGGGGSVYPSGAAGNGGAGGGGGSTSFSGAGGTGGSGINSGGNGSGSDGNPGNGGTNTGGGGGGGRSTANIGGAGGSGVVILRYPNTYTVTIGAGLTGTTTTNGNDKVTTFTAGTGNISFS